MVRNEQMDRQINKQMGGTSDIREVGAPPKKY